MFVRCCSIKKSNTENNFTVIIKRFLWLTIKGMLTVLMRSLSGPRDMLGWNM